MPLGAAQLVWLIATAVILLRPDHDAGAGGGGNRSATGEPGEPEPGGGLTSSGLSERYGDIRLFYALLVAAARP